MAIAPSGSPPRPSASRRAGARRPDGSPWSSPLVLRGSVFLLFVGLAVAGAFTGLGGSALKSTQAESSVAQACDQSKGKCCTTPEGRQVPPGTRRGPFTCLPDGSWG